MVWRCCHLKLAGFPRTKNILMVTFDLYLQATLFDIVFVLLYFCALYPSILSIIYKFFCLQLIELVNKLEENSDIDQH